MDKMIEAFEAFLKKKGLRLTEQRRQIIRKILSVHTHFTAESLYETIRRDHASIGKATLYRTLALLTECEVLEAHDFGGESKFYEHKLGHKHHDHMVCIQCHRIMEFKDDRIEAEQEAMAKRMRFRTLFHTLKIYGLCSKCK